MWLLNSTRQTQESRRPIPRGSPLAVSSTSFEKLLTASELSSKAAAGLTALLSARSQQSLETSEMPATPTGSRLSTSSEIAVPDRVTPRRFATFPLHLIRPTDGYRR